MFSTLFYQSKKKFGYGKRCVQTSDVKVQLCRHCAFSLKTRSLKQRGTYWRNGQKLTAWCVMEECTAEPAQDNSNSHPIPDELIVSKGESHPFDLCKLTFTIRAQNHPTHTLPCAARSRHCHNMWAAGLCSGEYHGQEELLGSHLAGEKHVSPMKSALCLLLPEKGRSGGTALSTNREFQWVI